MTGGVPVPSITQRNPTVNLGSCPGDPLVAGKCIVTQEAHMGRQVILVVEDEVLIRMMLSDLLRDAGYETVEAASADEGLQIMLTGRRLDLLITDVRMPGEIDGSELATRWKQLDASRPIIMASGHLSPGASRPAEIFLPKPYTDASLLRAVVDLIGPPCQDESQSLSAS